MCSVAWPLGPPSGYLAWPAFIFRLMRSCSLARNGKPPISFMLCCKTPPASQCATSAVLVTPSCARNLKCSSENRLANVSGAANASFVYDSDGNRVKSASLATNASGAKVSEQRSPVFQAHLPYGGTRSGSCLCPGNRPQRLPGVVYSRLNAKRLATPGA